MNILFLTLLDFRSLDDRNIYTDLLREFIKNGHSLYIISPTERRKKESTHIIKYKTCTVLKLKIGNIQKTNTIEKGLSTLGIEPRFIQGIKKYVSNVKFDLVLYSTPPITFCNAIEFIRKRDNAKTYLLLKDIFPQNAVDMGMLKKTGLKGFIYRYFRRKEKRLYDISDYIGCMSQANVDYILKHNAELDKNTVEVCPNSIEILDISIDDDKRKELRKTYGLPLDKKIFVYGGNLGRPQGIDFLVKCLREQQNYFDNIYFLIIGDGTEYTKLESFVKYDEPKNISLMKKISKAEYDALVAACDIGMLLLDYRFSIPNFPSRMLSYMQAKLPVFACTDVNTDVGDIIVDNGFGWWCESRNTADFVKKLKEILAEDISPMKEKGFSFLKENYSADKSYDIIISKF